MSARLRQRLRRPSPSLLVAMVALLVSLGGTATAAGVLITSNDIKDGTIRLADLSATTKQSLHSYSKSADTAVGLNDVDSLSAIHASSSPRPRDLYPLGENREFPESVLPLDSTSKAPNVAARVYSANDQPTHIQIAFGPVQRLTFDHVSFDTDHLFDPAHPTQLRAPVAGIYLITTNVSWAVDWARNGYNRAVYVYRNEVQAIAVDQRPPAEETRQVVTTVYRLNAGDTIEVGIAQDAGDLTANAVGDYAPALSMVWLAPG